MAYLKVTSARERFRRGGLEFTRQPTIIDTDDLAKDQVAAIKAEPNLNVQQATKEEVEAAGFDDGKKDDGKK